MWNYVATLFAVGMLMVISHSWGMTKADQAQTALYNQRNATAAAKLHEFSQAAEAYLASNPAVLSGCSANNPCNLSPKTVEPAGWGASNGWGQTLQALAWKDTSGSGLPVVFAYYVGQPSKSALGQAGLGDTPQVQESLAYNIGNTYMTSYAGPNEVPGALNGSQVNGMDNSFVVNLKGVRSKYWEPAVLNNYDLSPVTGGTGTGPGTGPGTGGKGGGPTCGSVGINCNICPGQYHFSHGACCGISRYGKQRCIRVP